MGQEYGYGAERGKQRKAVPNAAINAVVETLSEQDAPTRGDTHTGGTTYMQARAANEILKAQTARIRLQQLKKELVDRSKALAHVFKLARQERDSWIGWPARVSAQMAADLNVDAHAMHVTLETYAAWIVS